MSHVHIYAIVLMPTNYIINDQVYNIFGRISQFQFILSNFSSLLLLLRLLCRATTVFFFF